MKLISANPTSATSEAALTLLHNTSALSSTAFPGADVMVGIDSLLPPLCTLLRAPSQETVFHSNIIASFQIKH